MWKAGLLAELDEAEEARNLLRQALLEIRRALRTQGQNIELLSLEGWCIYLLLAVEPSLDMRSLNVVRDEFEERLEEMKAWDCSPWPLKEYFDRALEGTPPSRPTAERRIHGFDPGQVTLSHHLGGGHIEPYLPAFACIRLHEQVGIPMRLRFFNMTGDTLKNACRWILPFIGFWSPALLIRAGRHVDIRQDDLLSRTQVAAMEPSLAKRLYNWCLQILEREIVAPLTMTVASAQESILAVVSEVLSRLTFKMDSADHQRTFPAIQKLYGDPSVRRHVTLRDSCILWFQRLFDAADDNLLLQWLPELIRAPIFATNTADGWRDPAWYFPTEVGQQAQEKPDILEKIREATDWLIKRLRSEPEAERQTAIMRLIRVYYCRVMTPSQEQELAEVLWNSRGSNDLPSLGNVSAFDFLHLPAPSNVEVGIAVKKHILSMSSQGIVIRDTNGRTSMSASWGWEQPLIRQAALASKPIVELMGESRGLVEWTNEESKQLYEKARAWWATDKQVPEREKEADPIGLRASLRKSVGRLGEFLARAVVPNMKEVNDNEWKVPLDWLEELRAFDAYPTVVCLTYCCIGPAKLRLLVISLLLTLIQIEKMPLSRLLKRLVIGIIFSPWVAYQNLIRA